MFGLSALEAQGDPPQTTLDKLLFLIKYIFIEDRVHWLTAKVGFGSLAALIIFRSIKRRVATRFDWVKWIPEVLLAVIAFTGIFFQSVSTFRFIYILLQPLVPNLNGKRMV